MALRTRLWYSISMKTQIRPSEPHNFLLRIFKTHGTRRVFRHALALMGGCLFAWWLAFIFTSSPQTIFLLDDSSSDSNAPLSLDNPLLDDGQKEGGLLFVGDIMLARKVEEYLNQSPDHSLKRFPTLPENYSGVGNFESAVPRKHLPTPYYTFRFSTKEEHLQTLRTAGFHYLSLANNHTLDFGPEDFAHTVSALARADLIPFGHPTIIDSRSVTYINFKDEIIALTALNRTFGQLDSIALASELAEAEKKSDWLIAYIHWGEEYEPTHSTAQAALADELIANGVDLIIGHHPHVVQDIERRDGVLVFYSLGNFIFDQYFSREVEEGLTLLVTPTKKGLDIELKPVTSLDRQSSPRPMTADEVTVFLTGLSERSDHELARAILAGRLFQQKP